jgi:hypothetical protein
LTGSNSLSPKDAVAPFSAIGEPHRNRELQPIAVTEV